MVSAAKQTAPPDKLLNPPRCGGKSMGSPGPRSANLHFLGAPVRSLSRKILSIAMKILKGDAIFIGKPDRLPSGAVFVLRLRCRG